jgi:hypothetical protein
LDKFLFLLLFWRENDKGQQGTIWNLIAFAWEVDALGTFTTKRTKQAMERVRL